jgi:archaellum component FlaC
VIDFNSTYNDLVTEIEILETRIKDMERERNFLLKNMYANAPKFAGVVDYSKDRVSGGQLPLSLDKIVERLNKIDDNLTLLTEQLRGKKDAKQKIEKMLGELEGLDYKVAYMRDVLNMTLHEIADKLGYSHDHIRRVSSRVKKAKRKDATFMPHFG